MKTILAILIIVVTAVSMAPFLEVSIKIEWITYLGIPLVILAGSAGAAFLTKRFEAIIGGSLLAVLWPELYESVITTLGSI